MAQAEGSFSKMEIICPYCGGTKVLINRFNHMNFYDCPLCKGKGKIKVTQETNMETLTIRTVTKIGDKEIIQEVSLDSEKPITSDTITFLLKTMLDKQQE